MNEPKVKFGRGRTKGSFSFTTMKLSDLCAQLNPNTNVVVSRKWVEAIGLTTDAVAKNSLETLKQTNVPAETSIPIAVEVEL
jgi:hypothetical protein